LSKKPFQKELAMHRLTFDPGQRRVLLLVDIIFAMKKVSVDLFRAVLYILIIVPHKDVLFHCSNQFFNSCLGPG
jgi:hypothetical protein